MRLIDADKIMTDIASAERSTSKDYSLLSIARYIRIQPTIDAEPIRYGKWIYEPKDAIEMMFTKPKCSKCGYESADGLHYCSNCGAKMDEVEE